jgi:hypothetical protein
MFMIYPLHSHTIQFGWHPSRVKCFFEMAIGMIQSRSVQAQRIAAHFKDGTSLEGRIQRIYRFYAEQDVCLTDVALSILNCLGLQNTPLNLVLDRTNWEFGDKSINYLVLAVQVQGFGAVPLLWVELSKKGNSNTAERIILLDDLLTAIPSLQIASLTADREFIGKRWIDYLIKNDIPFFIRIKQNRLVDWSGEDVQVGTFFEHLFIGSRPRKLYKTIDGYDLTLVGVRSKEGELVIILTNADRNPTKVLIIYKTRWGIECLFKNLKRNGLNLEDTHMTFPQRLEKLMAVCAFATALCIGIGIAKHTDKPIPYRKTVQSYLYSFFQYGLNHIRWMGDGILKWSTELNPKKPAILMGYVLEAKK